MSLAENEYVLNIRDVFIYKIPFGEFLEESGIMDSFMPGGGYVISLILGYLRSDAVTFYSVFSDVITSSIAGFIVFLFNRANHTISKLLPGFNYEIVMSILLVIWSIFGFCLASTITYYVDVRATNTTTNVIMKITLALLCLILHAAILANWEIPKSFGRINIVIRPALKVVVKNIIGGLVCSFFVALVVYWLDGIFDYSKILFLTFAVIIAALILRAQRVLNDRDNDLIQNIFGYLKKYAK